MSKKISPPPDFLLIKKGKLSILVRNDYKTWILEYCEKDLTNLFHSSKEPSHYFEGRKRYPTIMFPDGKRGVVRQYSHGGLLRFFTRDLFIFGARSFHELILIEEILQSGIPTVEPIAAIHQTLAPPFYRPYLLTLEVPNALNLVEYFEKLGSIPNRDALLHKRKIIRSAGLLLRKFHQAGFYHRDLQLKNLLVSGDEMFIIDFDRSYRKASLTPRDRIKNLLRFNRSADKWRNFGLSISQTDRLRFLYAYAGEDKKIFEEIRKALLLYSVSLFFHRLVWKIQKFLKKVQSGSLRNWV